MDGLILDNGKKTIAAFDFDGTITTRDTLTVFILFATTIYRKFTGTLLTIPFIALYKLKIIPNYKAKEKLFRAFFGGASLCNFNSLSDKFSYRIEKLTNPEAILKIKWHQQMGHEVIIISASAVNWIKPWASRQGIKTVLATELEVNHGKITGNFLSKNCYGPEKVKRLLAQYPDRGAYTLYAYGDSKGDKELLALADHPFYRSFI